MSNNNINIEAKYELLNLKYENIQHEFALLKRKYEKMSKDFDELHEFCEENTIIQSMNDMKLQYELLEDKVKSYEKIIQIFLPKAEAVHTILLQYEKLINKQIDSNSKNELKIILKAQFSMLSDILDSALSDSRKYLQIKYNF